MSGQDTRDYEQFRHYKYNYSLYGDTIAKNEQMGRYLTQKHDSYLEDTSPYEVSSSTQNELEATKTRVKKQHLQAKYNHEKTEGVFDTDALRYYEKAQKKALRDEIRKDFSSIHTIEAKSAHTTPRNYYKASSSELKMLYKRPIILEKLNKANEIICFRNKKPNDLRPLDCTINFGDKEQNRNRAYYNAEKQEKLASFEINKATIESESPASLGLKNEIVPLIISDRSDCGYSRSYRSSSQNKTADIRLPSQVLVSRYYSNSRAQASQRAKFENTKGIVEQKATNNEKNNGIVHPISGGPGIECLKNELKTTLQPLISSREPKPPHLKNTGYLNQYDNCSFLKIDSVSKSFRERTQRTRPQFTVSGEHKSTQSEVELSVN